MLRWTGRLLSSTSCPTTSAMASPLAAHSVALCFETTSLSVVYKVGTEERSERLGQLDNSSDGITIPSATCCKWTKKTDHFTSRRVADNLIRLLGKEPMSNYWRSFERRNEPPVWTIRIILYRSVTIIQVKVNTRRTRSRRKLYRQWFQWQSQHNY